ISNLHLMALGISDFSPLQVRNILAGIAVTIYVLAACIAAFPISLLAVATLRFFRGLRKRSIIASLAWLVGILVCLPVSASVSLSALYLFVHLLFPWKDTSVTCSDLPLLDLSGRIECIRSAWLTNIWSQVAVVQEAFVNIYNIVPAIYLLYGL